MSMYNTLLLTITCPRCGAEAEMEADFRFGLRDLTRYRIGDRLPWEGMGVKTPEKRPEGGNYDDEAYAVCPDCERDFWLTVSVRNDVIVSAAIDNTKQPYISDEPLQQEEQVKRVKFNSLIPSTRTMEPFIIVRRDPYEEPYHTHLEFVASNGTIGGSTDIYCAVEDLKEIGTALQHFPARIGDEYRYEYGSEDPENPFHRYFMLRAYTTDSVGHCAIQFAMNQNSAEPGEGLSRFSITAEAASVKGLGKLFEEFSELRHLEFRWSRNETELFEDYQSSEGTSTLPFPEIARQSIVQIPNNEKWIFPASLRSSHAQQAEEDDLLKALPRSHSEILAAIQTAQQDGPATIAQIAMLCLWWVGQHDQPRRSYSGPDGLLPLDHLMGQFELQRQDDRPAFISGSTLADITRLFPKPAPPQPPTVRVSDEEAREQIEHAIQEAQQAIYPIRQNFLLCESLVDFAKRGCTSDQLQPLLQLLIKEWSSNTDTFGNGPRALLQVGENRLAFQMLDSIPFTSFMGATIWSDCAKILVELEQPIEARRLLDRIWAERQSIHSERLASAQVRVAEIYAYLGDAKTARQIVSKASVESCLLIECVVAWEQYLHNKNPNLNKILQLFRETRRLEPPKHRAHIQTAVLKLLLHLGKYEEAWDLLPLIRNSLLAIPLWSKLEFRAYEVAAALLPYCGKFASVIHPFAVDLLVSKAKDQELWPMVHMVSGLGKLIIRWSDEDGLSALLTFLKSWRDTRAG